MRMLQLEYNTVRIEGCKINVFHQIIRSGKRKGFIDIFVINSFRYMWE